MPTNEELVEAGQDARLALLQAIKQAVDKLNPDVVAPSRPAALLTLAEAYAWAMSTDQAHGGRSAAGR